MATVRHLENLSFRIIRGADHHGVYCLGRDVYKYESAVQRY
jgi:hypothetical protein